MTEKGKVGAKKLGDAQVPVEMVDTPEQPTPTVLAVEGMTAVQHIEAATELVIAGGVNGGLSPQEERAIVKLDTAKALITGKHQPSRRAEFGRVL